MSYIVPFQSVALFENTFKRQINKTTGKIDQRKFVFDRLFGERARLAVGIRKIDSAQVVLRPDLLKRP